MIRKQILTNLGLSNNMINQFLNEYNYVKNMNNLTGGGQIKILSYNVLYKATLRNSKLSQCKNNKCLDNLISFIDDNSPFDIIALQEITEFGQNYIIKNSKYLNKNMKYIKIPYFSANREGQITFYNKNKFKLKSNGINIIKTYYSSGRPITIIFFENNLCFINNHAGHGHNKFKLNNTPTTDYNFNNIFHYIKNNNKYYVNFFMGDNGNKQVKKITNSQYNNIVNSLKTYNIIIAGDFNHKNPIGKKRFNIFDRKFYGINKNITCCLSDKTLKGKHTKTADHILSTFPNGKYNKISNDDITKYGLISDHLPIIKNVKIEN